MSSVTPPQRSDNNEPQPWLVISAHDTGIWKLAYLPDGRRVVTGSDGGTVKVWNLESGEQEGTSMEHKKGILDLAVTRDGKNIVSSDVDGKIKVWDVESHELVKEWTHPDRYPTIAISPDDQLIAAGAVAIYTMEGRRIKNSIKVGKLGVLSMCFSPDGNRLACGTRNDMRVYDVDNATLVLEAHQDWVCDVVWSRDGSRLFSRSADETIRCWNSDTGEQIGRWRTGHANYIRSLSLSSDGSILASASLDHTIRFWDATTGNSIGQHLQHDKQVNAVCFSPSGESVVSVAGDGKIYLWRVPWSHSVDNRVRIFIRCTSVFILIPLSI